MWAHGGLGLWGAVSGLFLGPSPEQLLSSWGVCSSDPDDRPVSPLSPLGTGSWWGRHRPRCWRLPCSLPCPGHDPYSHPSQRAAPAQMRSGPAAASGGHGAGYHAPLLPGSPPEATGRDWQPQPGVMPATCWTGLRGAERPVGLQSWENYLTFGGLSFHCNKNKNQHLLSPPHCVATEQRTLSVASPGPPGAGGTHGDYLVFLQLGCALFPKLASFYTYISWDRRDRK